MVIRVTVRSVTKAPQTLRSGRDMYIRFFKTLTSAFHNLAQFSQCLLDPEEAQPDGAAMKRSRCLFSIIPFLVLIPCERSCKITVVPSPCFSLCSTLSNPSKLEFDVISVLLFQFDLMPW
jgi:hypothetical protein